MVGFGWALGLAGSAVFAVSIRSLLFGIAPTDPLTYTLASAAVWIAGTAGCLVPAIRASRIDPIAALRTD
jgi:putative ABC transport system permease protein